MCFLKANGCGFCAINIKKTAMCLGDLISKVNLIKMSVLIFSNVSYSLTGCVKDHTKILL
jgi:hypothetical protein